MKPNFAYDQYLDADSAEQQSLRETQARFELPVRTSHHNFTASKNKSRAVIKRLLKQASLLSELARMTESLLLSSLASFTR